MSPWQNIYSGGDGTISRMKIEGGWIYRYNPREGACSIAFVPELPAL